jgi:hypothetical protein
MQLFRTHLSRVLIQLLKACELIMQWGAPFVARCPRKTFGSPVDCSNLGKWSCRVPSTWYPGRIIIITLLTILSLYRWLYVIRLFEKFLVTCAIDVTVGSTFNSGWGHARAILRAHQWTTANSSWCCAIRKGTTQVYLNFPGHENIGEGPLCAQLRVYATNLVYSDNPCT